MQLLLLLSAIVGSASAFGGLRREHLDAIAASLGPPPCAGGVCGEPLELSSLIASDPAKARTASAVVGLKGFEGSHSGLITVNPQGNAHFFWFLPARAPASNIDGAMPMPPTIMWLQGGPVRFGKFLAILFPFVLGSSFLEIYQGAPSTYGMFTEIGPIIVGEGGTLTQRNHTWNSKYNLLIVVSTASTKLLIRPA